jgi:hypothetical protein
LLVIDSLAIGHLLFVIGSLTFADPLFVIGDSRAKRRKVGKGR